MELTVAGVLDTARNLLKGEPARAIGYGAAAIIYLVALALDAIPDMPPEDALIAATAAIATISSVIETIRHFVYSPATVASIVTTPPTAAGPIVAAVEQGAVSEADIVAAASETEPPV